MNVRNVRFWLAVGFVIASSAAASRADEPAEQFPSPQRWEKTIQKFEAADRDQPVKPGGVLFIGSSSIRMWDLSKYFPKHKPLNRGFGGSHMEDSVYFADRIVHPYQPKMIVVYAGDNDIKAGKSPQRVLADYQKFVASVHAKLPKTRIAYIAIKPSISRWALVEKMRTANGLINEVAQTDDRLSFVDIDTPMIGADGRPKPELFVQDGLHLSAAGYDLWSELVRKHLEPSE